MCTNECCCCCEGAPREPHALPHGRAAIRVRGVWQVLPTQGQPAVPPAVTQQGHSGAAVQVRPVPEGLHVQGAPRVAQAESLGHALHVRAL